MSATAGQTRDDSLCIDITLSTAKVIGNPDKIQGLVGVYQKGGAANDKVPFRIRGPIYATKLGATGRTWTKGQKLYYRATGPKITDQSTGNVLCGFAAEDAAATDTAGWVYLTPNVVG